MATDAIGHYPPSSAEMPVPDLMNDPQYATNLGNSEDGTVDADTCRICRGEATEQELFYPCKCSGSIKFVHQDCLMEWLSHSQKKHCELCKTPFHFTKLYSPNMPQTLPTHVFLRHLAIHAVKNLAIWLRFCVVVFVWLGCLPWAMRHVWGFLFWFGDGGWTTKSSNPRITYNDTVGAMELLVKLRQDLEVLVGNGTSPASPLLTVPTTSATVGNVLDKLPALMRPLSRIFNLSQPEPFPIGYLKDIYHGLSVSLSRSSLNATNVTTVTQFMDGHRHVVPGHSSLLSNVRFLKGLTRHPSFNKIIITALEGQIITIVVVVCFVLVFLIREWVVQQQPGINMGAGFNAEFAGERAPRRNILPDNAPDADGLPAGRRNIEGLQDAVQRPAADVAARPIARPRRRMVRFEDGRGNDPRPVIENADLAISLVASSQDGEGEDTGEGSTDGKTHQRPVTLARDALSPAAEIQRSLAEDSSKTQDRFDAGEFVSLWRRAGGSPEEVLRIIEAEGLGEKLRYWKNAVKGLQANSAHTSSLDNQRSSTGLISLDDSTDSLAGQRSNGTNSSNDSWVDVSGIPLSLEFPQKGNEHANFQENMNSDASSSSGKGKEKALDVSCEPLLDLSSGSLPGIETTNTQPSVVDEEVSRSLLSTTRDVVSFQSGPGRPRAISDGPQPRESISPLAEHYWSFSNLPETRSLDNTQGSTSNIHTGGHQNAEQNISVKSDHHLANRETLVSLPSPNSSSPISSTDITDTPFQGVHDHIEIYNADRGTTQTAKSWDEVFENNPVSDSEDEFGEIPNNRANIEQNPFHPDGLLPQDILPENIDQVQPRHPEPRGVWAHIANFLWGDVNVPHEGRADDDEHIVQDIAAEAPFVPVVHHGHGIFEDDEEENDEGEANQDREVLAAALAAGIDPNDPDALDDVEDFEGIMELVGMRGPFTALIQNGIFSAVLISLTVACGVWIPYNIGRLVLLLIANPIASIKLPLKLLFSFAAVLQDLALVILGGLSYLLIQLCSMPKLLYSHTSTGPALPMTFATSGPASESLRFAKTAGERIIDGVVTALVQIPDSEVPAFSAVSHEALLYIKAIISNSLQYIGAMVNTTFVNPANDSGVNASMALAAFWGTLSEFGIEIMSALRRVPALLATAEPWVISLEMPARTVPVDPCLSYWNGVDRFWAILAGYIALSFLGAAYLRKGSPFLTNQVGREWEATVIDVLNQAGGVMKVILIISIEMLVFPLYCGLLLDLALLPLFENATVLSRILFTIDSPLTSVFVHWFVGTCYMFHFALFVSMCRKIMRNGVLYFIRDPDDPTFHPVRDVLERNVATQLRKITFSAMVYGALVVICLGGVVWGLAFAFPGVLPIHWSSNEPVLEFPIDLLFYNFFMPLAVKFFKPSDGLHAMYAWWFRKCARMLRLTWFLFDERKLDEEGRHVRKSWGNLLRRVEGDTANPIKPDQVHDFSQENPSLQAYFLRDGRFVRVPASDQVRIPKGGQVFLEVDESNARLDGGVDNEDGLHGRNSELFKMVYVPPYFRGRIFLFILFIWMFAAVTGVCITIVPLVFGRQIFARIIPPHVRKNDVYAFSIGIYILGSALYSIIHLKQGVEHLRKTFAIDAETPNKVLRQVTSVGLRILRLIYAYTAFIIVLPSLFAFAVEFYFIVPLHTYFAVSEPHIIHFVQSWTLGLLYVKLTTRLILWHADSRPAKALEAVIRNGYLDPDIKVATRAFIFPATTILITALIFPFSLASMANRYEVFGHDEEQKMLVYRYAYPFCLSMVINVTGIWLLMGVMKGWRMRIRDEVYLIGERLHNFGDRSKSGTVALIPTGTRLET